MSDVRSAIPSSILRWLPAVPVDRPVVLLLRHAERPELQRDDVGYSLPITDFGAYLSYELGKLMRGRLCTLHCSPLARCVQTAEHIRKGAELEVSIEQTSLLGDPGIYVVDPELAWSNWLTMGNEGVMEHMASADHALPGMLHPEKAAKALVKSMLNTAGSLHGLHVFVTHDVLVSATVARFLGAFENHNPWPNYLEGAFFWWAGAGVCIAYRDRQASRGDW